MCNSYTTGPLLWHYSDSANEPSVELTYDEIKEVITAVGFEFIVSIVFYPSQIIILESRIRKDSS